jgi:hypothetical protein
MINDKLELIWKEAFVNCLKFYPGLYLEELKKYGKPLSVPSVSA